MLKHTVVSGLILLGIAFNSFGQTIDVDVENNWFDWPTVGSADFNWLLFDVYHSELKVKTGTFKTDKTLVEQDLVLIIRYERSISSDQFSSATLKQWQQMGYDQAFIDKWQVQLTTIFPAVVENDQLAMMTIGESKSVMLFKANSSHDWKEIRTFSDPVFTERFLAIWLSDKSQYPKLRQQLIGAK